MILRYEPKHFRPEEFFCKCGSACEMKGHQCDENAPMSALIVLALDIMRERLQMPVRVNSGRRCEAHNKTIGGDPKSRHKKSEAADVSASDYEKLVSVAVDVCAFLGLKIVRYDKEKFLHIQI